MAYVITLKMPEEVKEQFIFWCEEQENLGVDPYIVLSGSQQSTVGSILRKNAGNYLKKIWPQIVQPLQQLSNSNHSVLIVVLKNLPLDRNLPNIPTPLYGERQIKKGVVSELMILAISSIMKIRIRVGVTEEKPFNLPFHQIVPQKGLEYAIATNKGAGYFPLHNDRIFIKNPIEFIILYGLRGEEAQGVSTYFLRVSELVKGMPSNLYKTLFQKKFKDPNSNTVISLLHGTRTHYSQITSTLDLAEGWIQPLSNEAQESLSWLQNREKEIDNMKKYEVRIAPGIAVIADHRRLLHGRKAFNVSDGKYRRWLLRAHLSL